jgi:hypothetical protein
LKAADADGILSRGDVGCQSVEVAAVDVALDKDAAWSRRGREMIRVI